MAVEAFQIREGRHQGEVGPAGADVGTAGVSRPLAASAGALAAVDAVLLVDVGLHITVGEPGVQVGFGVDVPETR